MHSGGTSRHLLVTSPKRARAIWARAVTSVVGVDCDVEWQPCLSGRDSGHERPGECACSSHDGGWPLGPHPCRVARYRLDVRTGVGACSFGWVLHLLPSGAPPAL